MLFFLKKIYIAVICCYICSTLILDSGCVVDFPVFYYVYTESQMLGFSHHT